MKQMKRIFALALAVMMVMSLAITASAEGEGNYSITINNTAPDHIYEAYQIFSGDLSKESNPDSTPNTTTAVLSNIEWGDGVTYNGAGVDVTVDGKTTKSSKAADIAEALANNTLDLATFLNDLTLKTPAGTSGAQADNKYVISGLEPGYYLVKDKNDSMDNKDDTYTSYIVEVVENSVVSPKGDKPSSEKKVKDTNDSVADSTTNWQDSADHDIGDAVSFQLKATLPSELYRYDTYYLAFHDTQSAGLTFNADSVKVFVDGKEITSGFEVKTAPGDSCTFEVIINDVIAVGAKNNSVITVEYTSTLNENAVLGSAGNSNLMHIEYSNNPNWEGTGKPDDTGKTPDDKVIVFTYKVVANKYANEVKAGNELKGAGFTLYKKNSNGEWVQIGNEIVGEAMTTFEWKGLDDGDYKLEETTTPAGYNTIAPIEFTISAKHNTESDDPKLTELTGGDMFTGDVSTGAVTGNIVNKSGTTLPETGGIGTTIFYSLGGILVLVAVVLLVTKKRMASAE